MSRIFPLAALLLTASAAAVNGQAAPPIVEAVEWAPFRERCFCLMEGLEVVKAPLPAETTQALRRRSKGEPADVDAAAAAVQKLLDARCLLVVTINAESRVKAAVVRRRRNCGSIRRVLFSSKYKMTPDRPRRYRRPARNCGSRAGRRKGGGRRPPGHGTAVFPQARRRPPGIRRVRLTAHEAGKREATLRFDVGQGTQDLGFRQETPVLFTVPRTLSGSAHAHPKREQGCSANRSLATRVGIGSMVERFVGEADVEAQVGEAHRLHQVAGFLGAVRPVDSSMRIGRWLSLSK